MRNPALGVTTVVVLLTVTSWTSTTTAAIREQGSVSIGVMRVALDPVMVDGALVGATLSYVAAVDGRGATPPVVLSDDFHSRLQPGEVVRVHLGLSPTGCVEPSTVTVRAADGSHRFVGSATLALDTCAAVAGRSPADWARTSMMAGRPIQLMWSFLRGHRLTSSLGSLPNDWVDVRPALTFVDHSCADDCHAVLQLLLAVVALDSTIDPRFRSQNVVSPITMTGHTVGDCLALADLVDAIDEASPIHEIGRIEAVVETLTTLVHTPTGRLQCS